MLKNKKKKFEKKKKKIKKENFQILLEQKKNKELINLLEKTEINFNTKKNLLKNAILLNNFEIVNYLKKKGVKLDEMDKPAKSYIETIKNKDFSTLRLLIFLDQEKKKNNKKIENNNLLDIILKSNENVFSFLLKNGFEKNFLFYGNFSIVHYAVFKQNIKCLKMLIKYKCDINLKNNNKETPLHIAAKNGNLTIVKFLIEAGAKISEKNNFSETPLKIAFLERYQYVVLFLIKNKANIFEISNYFQDFLEFDNDRICYELFKIFLNENKNVNLDKILEISIQKNYFILIKNILKDYPVLIKNYKDLLENKFPGKFSYLN